MPSCKNKKPTPHAIQLQDAGTDYQMHNPCRHWNRKGPAWVCVLIPLQVQHLTESTNGRDVHASPGGGAILFNTRIPQGTVQMFVGLVSIQPIPQGRGNTAQDGNDFLKSACPSSGWVRVGVRWWLHTTTTIGEGRCRVPSVFVAMGSFESSVLWTPTSHVLKPTVNMMSVLNGIMCVQESNKQILAP